MEDLQQKKFRRMTGEPVERLVIEMAVPSIISMLVSAFYNMADTFFIGKLSTEATGAVGIVFSYMAFIQAFSFFFGHGSGSYISRELGRKNRRAAQEMAANGFFSCLFFGLALAAAGFVFMEPLLYGLGATPTILPEAKKYFFYILLGTPGMMGSLVLNNQMRLQGNARLGMFGVLTGAVLNLILDPVLIFGCGMGISGAAVATAFSQTVGFVVLLCLCGRGDGLKIRWKDYHPSLWALKEIAAGGLPSLARQGLASAATTCLNHMAGLYGGDPAIAAFSVVGRITFMCFSILIGFGQGFQPVCGFNYGAGQFSRVRKAFWFCVRMAAVVLFSLAALCFAFARPLVSAFRASDPVLVAIGVTALRWQTLSFPLFSWSTMSNMALQTARKTREATIIAISRQGLIFIPVLLLASTLWGLQGVYIAQPLADLGSFLLAFPLMRGFLKELSAPDKPLK